MYVNSLNEEQPAAIVDTITPTSSPTNQKLVKITNHEEYAKAILKGEGDEAQKHVAVVQEAPSPAPMVPPSSLSVPQLGEMPSISAPIVSSTPTKKAKKAPAKKHSKKGAKK
jgi:hypothetical protein